MFFISIGKFLEFTSSEEISYEMIEGLKKKDELKGKAINFIVSLRRLTRYSRCCQHRKVNDFMGSYRAFAKLHKRNAAIKAQSYTIIDQNHELIISNLEEVMRIKEMTSAIMYYVGNLDRKHPLVHDVTKRFGSEEYWKSKNIRLIIFGPVPSGNVYKVPSANSHINQYVEPKDYIDYPNYDEERGDEKMLHLNLSFGD